MRLATYLHYKDKSNGGNAYCLTVFLSVYLHPSYFIQTNKIQCEISARDRKYYTFFYSWFNNHFYIIIHTYIYPMFLYHVAHDCHLGKSIIWIVETKYDYWVSKSFPKTRSFKVNISREMENNIYYLSRVREILVWLFI